MLIEGRNPVIELLKSQRDTHVVYLEEGINVDPKINEIIARATSRNVTIKYIQKKKMQKMSKTTSHQGVMADADILIENFGQVVDKNWTHKKPNWYVYIRDAMIEANIGAIARSAEAAGIKNIIIPPKLSITPQSFRSSMGALANVHIIQESLFTAIKIAQQNAIKVIAIEVTGDKYHYEADLTGDVMIIIGGEDHPLSQPVTDRADEVVKIPMSGKINSLNMSVAASIVMFDKIRQENIAKK